MGRPTTIALANLLCPTETGDFDVNLRMTDEEFAEAHEQLADLHEEILQNLAEDLGGDPDDYRADETAVPGGE